MNSLEIIFVIILILLVGYNLVRLAMLCMCIVIHTPV